MVAYRRLALRGAKPLVIACLVLVTAELALAQSPAQKQADRDYARAQATIRIDSVESGTWTGRASYEFEMLYLLVLRLEGTSRNCCLDIQMRRSGKAPLRPGSYRVVVGPGGDPRDDDPTVFQTFVQLPNYGDFEADTATGTLIIISADSLWARGRADFKLFRRGFPPLPRGQDTLWVKATFNAVNVAELRRRASPSKPRTAEDNPPEGILSATLGDNRQAVKRYLMDLGWRQAFDSIGGIGNPSVYTGAIDGHEAQIVAMFGSEESPDRLLNFFVAFPARTAEELRSTYLWAYEFMKRRHCAPEMSAENQKSLDSLAELKVTLPPAKEKRTTKPVAPGYAVIDLGNLPWPKPAWAAANGLSGVQLWASALADDAAWPYQVTLWSSTLLRGGTPCGER